MGFGGWLAVGVTLGAMALGSGVGSTGVAQAQGFTDQPAVLTPPDPLLADSVSGVLARDLALSRVNIGVTVQN
ncbi:MAG TPA: hypothetical protein VMU50_21850, partial [Polyangia bacterium]|nr:hypothetical protein [Polyangia bacterium]